MTSTKKFFFVYTTNSNWLNLLENNNVNRDTVETIATALETTTDRDLSGG